MTAIRAEEAATVAVGVHIEHCFLPQFRFMRLRPFRGADQAWLRTGIDPQALTAVFVALDKRLDQLTADAKTLVADFKTNLEERVRKLKE